MSLHCHYCGKSGTALVSLAPGQYWPPPEESALVPDIGSPVMLNDKGDGSTIPRPSRWHCWDREACATRQIDKEKTPVRENENARLRQTVSRLEDEVRQLRHDLESLANYVAERDKADVQLQQTRTEVHEVLAEGIGRLAALAHVHGSDGVPVYSKPA